MSHTRSTALERSVIQLLGGLSRFYGIPTLTLCPGTVHTRRFQKMSCHLRQGSQATVSTLMLSKPFQSPYTFNYRILDYLDFTLSDLENPMGFYANTIA